MSSLDRRLLSVREAAQYLGRSEIAVREMTWNGKLPHIRTDRRVMFDIRDLDRWIDENRVEAS
jgi:excisionase family DNA binding protein